MQTIRRLRCNQVLEPFGNLPSSSLFAWRTHFRPQNCGHKFYGHEDFLRGSVDKGVSTFLFSEIFPICPLPFLIDFMDVWKKCGLSAGKPMSIKFLVRGGGVFWVLGGGECRFYFYGRADFSDPPQPLLFWLFCFIILRFPLPF